MIITTFAMSTTSRDKGREVVYQITKKTSFSPYLCGVFLLLCSTFTEFTTMHLYIMASLPNRKKESTITAGAFTD